MEHRINKNNYCGINTDLESDDFYRNYAKEYMFKTFNKILDVPIYFDRQNISEDYFTTFGAFINYDINNSFKKGCVIIIYIKNIVEKDATKLYYQKPVKSYHDCVLSIIEHELAHLYLYDEGLPYDDTDLEFIDLCFKNKIVLNYDDIHTKKFYSYKFKDKGAYMLELWKKSSVKNI